MFMYRLIFLILFFNFSYALKILVSTHNAGFSHIQFQGKIADALVDAGHEVHFLINVYNEKSDYNGTQKAHKIIRFHSEQPLGFENVDLLQNPFNSKPSDQYKFIGQIVGMMDIFCEEMTKNSSRLLDGLIAEKFDIGISETFDLCMFGVFEKIGIKTKILSSAVPLPDGISELFGIPLPRSYVPIFISSPVSAPKMSYMEKLQLLYDSWTINTAPHEGTDRILKSTFGQDFPSVLDIVRKVPYVFINTHEYLDQLKPISNKVIHIGGIALKKPKKLDDSLTPIFQKAKKGVVLFSFGSITNTDVMPESYRHAYLESFAKFPDYEFIWKFNLREQDKALFSRYPNVHPVNWLDQTSILAHPKTKGFMTHCGLNSFIEGSYAGVPFIATPLFADQNYNAAIIRNKETGVYLEFSKVTVETVARALADVLETEKYYRNAQQLKKKLETFPYTPTDRLIKFVEYAAENSIQDELNLPGANMSFIEYFYLDVIIPFLIGVLVLAYVVYRLLSCVIVLIVGTLGFDSKSVKVD